MGRALQPGTNYQRGLVQEMKLHSVKRRMALFCVNHIFDGTRFFAIKRSLLRAAGYEIGEGVKIVGPLLCTGQLKVGDGTWIGRDLVIHGNGTVEIGENCDIAPGVIFLTGGHAIGNCVRRAGEGETYTIRVGSGSWIGARATVGRNVTIGNSAVVAACACVTSDIPANTLVGGVPAKMIRELKDEF